MLMFRCGGLIMWNVQFICSIVVQIFDFLVYIPCFICCDTIARFNRHWHRGSIIYVVSVHVMLRQIAIRQPNACEQSQVTDSNDLKYVGRILDIHILSSVMRLIITYSAFCSTKPCSLYDVVSVDRNVLETIMKTGLDFSVRKQ